MFPDNAVIPKLGGVNIGWILAILAAAFVYFFMNYTKKGYEITVVGESIETARYAGMNISRIIVVAMLISGGLCGITGMIQASAIEKTLVYGIANGYGFTAIITAWLSKLNAGYAVSTSRSLSACRAQYRISFRALSCSLFWEVNFLCDIEYISAETARRWLDHGRILSSLRCSRNASCFRNGRRIDHRKIREHEPGSGRDDADGS